MRKRWIELRTDRLDMETWKVQKVGDIIQVSPTEARNRIANGSAVKSSKKAYELRNSRRSESV